MQILTKHSSAHVANYSNQSVVKGTLGGGSGLNMLCFANTLMIIMVTVVGDSGRAVLVEGDVVLTLVMAVAGVGAP